MARVALSPTASPDDSLTLMGPRPRGRSDVYLLSLAIVLMFLLVVVDVHNDLNIGVEQQGTRLRYLLIAIPCLALLFARMRRPSGFVRKPVLGDVFLFLLMTFGLSGTLYGTLFQGTKATGYPIFLPMIIAFLYLGTMDSMAEREARVLVRLLAWVGLIHAALASLAFSGRAPTITASRSYRNPKVLFVPMGFAAALSARRLLRLVLISAGAVYIFSKYPSGTSALMALVTLLTLFVTKPTARSARPYAVAAILLVASFVVAGNLSKTIVFTDQYFATVGKNDANVFRITEYRAALTRFRHSPVFGDVFTKDTIVTATEPSGTVIHEPYHNDYLLLAASGGAIALGLFIAWIVATEITILRRFRGLVAARQRRRAALVRTALVGFNAWFCAALFNPLLQGTATSTTLFGLYTILMAASSTRAPSMRRVPPSGVEAPRSPGEPLALQTT